MFASASLSYSHRIGYSATNAGVINANLVAKFGRRPALAGRQCVVAFRQHDDDRALKQPTDTMKMSNKRPIDRLRKSAGSMQISATDDVSEINSFLKIRDALYVLKTKGIYEIKLADQIDPARTDPSIPNTHQRVLSYGCESLFVSRTILTARRLFEQQYFPKEIDAERVVTLAFSTAKEFAAMQDIATAVSNAQSAAMHQTGITQHKERAMGLPALGDLHARAKNFIQVSDHAYKALFETTQVFFGDGYKKRWFETFAEFVVTKFGADDPFAKFIGAALPFLRFLRFMRDCVEHPGRGPR